MEIATCIYRIGLKKEKNGNKYQLIKYRRR